MSDLLSNLKAVAREDPLDFFGLMLVIVLAVAFWNFFKRYDR